MEYTFLVEAARPAEKYCSTDLSSVGSTNLVSPGVASGVVRMGWPLELDMPVDTEKETVIYYCAILHLQQCYECQGYDMQKSDTENEPAGRPGIKAGEPYLAL